MLKGHPAASQEDHLDRVHSDQMVLKMSGRGGWSHRAKLSGGQGSQTKGQGTVRLPLKWATAEAARQRARGPNKRATLMTPLLKKWELKAPLNWSTGRAKGSLPKKSTTVEKADAYSRLQNLLLQKVVVWCRWVRTRHANHKSTWQHFGVWGLSPEGDSSLKCGGAGSHTLPNRVIEKWMVNTTLTKGHHTQTWRNARNFQNFSHDSSTPIKLYIIIFDWGRQL